jgi:hypothetical protein
MTAKRDRKITSMQYADLRLVCDCYDGCLTQRLGNPVVDVQSVADPADRHVLAKVHPSVKGHATSTCYTQRRNEEAVYANPPTARRTSY